MSSHETATDAPTLVTSLWAALPAWALGRQALHLTCKSVGSFDVSLSVLSIAAISIRDQHRLCGLLLLFDVVAQNCRQVGSNHLDLAIMSFGLKIRATSLPMTVCEAEEVSAIADMPCQDTTL